MKRIGIAASKIAKGNMILYNFYVILISALFSSFIFIISGSIVFFGLMVITYFINEILEGVGEINWVAIQQVCMITLTLIIVLFNLVAVCINLKFTKTEESI